jgi:hypothetical protein
MLELGKIRACPIARGEGLLPGEEVPGSIHAPLAQAARSAAMPDGVAPVVAVAKSLNQSGIELALVRDSKSVFAAGKLVK